jgi:hypothetical protein
MFAMGVVPTVASAAPTVRQIEMVVVDSRIETGNNDSVPGDSQFPELMSSDGLDIPFWFRLVILVTPWRVEEGMAEAEWGIVPDGGDSGESEELGNDLLGGGYGQFVGEPDFSNGGDTVCGKESDGSILT